MTVNFAKTAGAALCAVCTALAATTAAAADLGSPRGYPPPQPAAQPWYEAAPWTGFYIGATYGAGLGRSDTTTAAGQFDIRQSGGIATAFAGYDYQIGRSVIGIEADIGAGRLNGAGNDSLGGQTSVGLDKLGSLRARAGFLVTPSLLAYATGGFAWSRFDLTAANGVTFAQNFSGYQVGGGLQYKISRAWDLRLEYLFTDLGHQTVTHGGLTNTYDPSFSTVRAGLSFKF